MTTGESLKNLREERGEMQKDVAEKLGIAQNTLSGYEHNTRKPSSKILKQLANYYGVTTDFLLGEEKGLTSLEKEFPDAVKALRRANNNLSPSAKRRLIKMMKAFIDLEEDNYE